MIKQFHEQFREHVKLWHGREHYSYQDRISHAVLSAIEESAAGVTVEIPIQLPRQAGKTTSIVDLVEFLLASFHFFYKRPIRIGIFAPQIEQATTDFDRLKIQYNEITPLGFSTKMRSDEDKKFPNKWNSKTIRLFYKDQFVGEVYIFPISKTSNPESKTLDVIIIEEAQDVNDEKMKRSVFPMGASTNAPRIYVGTSGTRICYFKDQLDTNPRAIKISLEDVFKARKEVAEETNDPIHFQYQNFVNSEIQSNGWDSDYIKTQYRGIWVIGTGQFVTTEALEAMIDKGRGFIMKSDKPVYVGIDTAKSPDQTVVTIIGDKKDKLKSELLCWLSLPGENYSVQFDIIKDFLKTEWEEEKDDKGRVIKDREGRVKRKLIKGFSDIKMIAIDSTGQGDFMPDMFEQHTSYNINRVKFSAESKDVIYKNLLQVIHNSLTTIPDAPRDKDFLGWKKEMVNLEKEYKGRFLSVHHPDDPKAHDDYPDSWALAEYAKSETIKNEPSISIF